MNTENNFPDESSENIRNPEQENDDMNLFGDRYTQMSDEEIVDLCHNGDSDA